MICTEPAGPLLVSCPLLHGTETENIFRNTTLRKTPVTLPAMANKKIILRFICPCSANVFPNYNQQDATFLDLFISTDALHVSGGFFADHQEHRTVHTASGIVNQYCCWLLAWMSWMRSTTAASNNNGLQYLKLYVAVLCS